MKRESTDMNEMCLKLDTASFLPCTVTSAVYINSLRMDTASFAITLYLLTALKDTESLLSNQSHN